MLLGVEHVVVKTPLAARVALEKLTARAGRRRKVDGSGIALHVRLSRPGCGARHQSAARKRRGDLAGDARDADGGAEQAAASWSTGAPRGVDSTGVANSDSRSPPRVPRRIGRGKAGRSPSRRRGSPCTTPGTAATWTKAGRAGCWSSTASARRGCTTPRSRPASCATKYDAIILPDQNTRSILDGNTATTTRPEYRGGIGEEGVAALKAFVDDGGTLITLGRVLRSGDRASSRCRSAI